MTRNYKKCKIFENKKINIFREETIVHKRKSRQLFALTIIITI